MFLHRAEASTFAYMEKKQSKALAELHSALHSPLAEIRDAALKRVKKEGEVSTVAELIRLRGETDEASVRREVDDVLRGLKLEGAGEALLSSALDSQNLEQLPELLACLWECGGSADGHLKALSTKCVEMGMPVMVEALTLFEALPDLVEDEGDLLEAMLILKQGAQALEGGNAEAEIAMLGMMWKELAGRERA